jgi:adenine-specific DNA-methyltransferase
MRKLFIEKAYDTAYSKVLLDRALPYDQWSWEGISEAAARELGFESVREAKRGVGDAFEDEVARFAIGNARRVFQTVAIGGGAAIKRRDTIRRSRLDRDKVFVHPGEDMPDFYILNGRQIVFYDKRLIEADGRRMPGEIVTDVWTDISWNGISSEGSVEFKNGKKPELLIRRVLEMSTTPGDVVLDSFAGSGTTGAVAHKMGRKWIMVELGEHCHTHIIPRLKKVIDGTDPGGITEAVNWKGGGGFRYYRVGPSLLKKDKFDNWVISPEFNDAMLAEAVCKLEGFTYAPSDSLYWQHGHSTESDFIYVTTQTLTREMLAKLSDEVGPNRSLLICCSAFRCDVSQFENLTVKKIPKAVLKKCEWGHDDYSLEIKNLPAAPPREQSANAASDASGAGKPPSKAQRRAWAAGPSLFDTRGNAS